MPEPTGRPRRALAATEKRRADSGSTAQRHHCRIDEQIDDSQLPGQREQTLLAHRAACLQDG